MKYTFDGRFFPTTPPDTTESEDEDSDTRQKPNSRYSAPSQTANLRSSIGVITNTMLKLEHAELRTMKKREMARLEAENRRAELEFEMTRMMLQTQLQIASLVSQNSSTRKRKRFMQGWSFDSEHAPLQSDLTGSSFATIVSKGRDTLEKPIRNSVS
ncbi:hypothetical protein BUALT_Bualt03G0081500 [Buddleja alternifolia]|uniref:Uncharacterized protein n=1 Tax=Buddleja alternifolia TaxID=168488 RepID=A0AAV6XYT0_9LAMI|nr:hypothetical protein BUALT_Bualt03G0081500 [Buddleja alternifolia]